MEEEVSAIEKKLHDICKIYGVDSSIKNITVRRDKNRRFQSLVIHNAKTISTALKETFNSIKQLKEMALPILDSVLNV
jgi:hypothetical protein